ncbi:hypothetical protein AAG906_019964 [Vitis piasezkii]
MATNKERIENLEMGLGGLQANLSIMELGVNDKLHQLENAISKISEVLSTRQDPTSSNVNERSGQSSYGRSHENTEGRRPMFSSKLGTLETQKVSLASFHLEGEENQWWQWLCKAYHEERKEPKSLKEAISLARMRDEQLNRHETATRPFSRTTIGSSPTKMKTLSPMKRFTWAEMQRRRAQGLCFNCDEKFALGHKCKGPQLLLLEGNYDEEENDEVGAHTHLQGEPEISLHALTGWSTARTMRVSAKVGPHELIVLIDKFEDIYQEPKQLPPEREIDHHINLKEGTEPINVRPYKFPIPTVDGMLDELYGATFFTKLDLRSGYHQLGKCAFGQQEVEYLGHIVTPQGVKPRPTNVSDLRGFLGLTGYYRKFVLNYGVIARPLTNLLKKGQFRWTEEAEDAFKALKQAMTSTPTLAMPNFNEPFVIESDASGTGIGAVLTQQGRPIAFMSRALGITKQSWSTYAKEMLAIVQAIRTWRPYLLGRKFYIRTDQRSLKYLMEQCIVTPEQQKWVSKLLGYDYDITYEPGRENSTVDALSRVTGGPNLNTLFEFHDSPYGGHSGVLRTYKQLTQQFYWPSMHKVIQQYVTSCTVFQKNKAETLSPVGLLQPLPIPCQVWDDITMDFIEGLPPSNGQNDRDPIFISHFWREFFKMSSTKLHMSSAYHPQTDGQSEVVNKRAYQKLASRFYGPYQIEEKVRKVAYKLKQVGETKATSTELPPLTDDGEIIMEPEAILNTRWVKKGSSFVEEILLRNKYINLNLEDKVRLKEGNSDKLRRSTRVPIRNPRKWLNFMYLNSIRFNKKAANI